MSRSRWPRKSKHIVYLQGAFNRGKTVYIPISWGGEDGRLRHGEVDINVCHHKALAKFLVQFFQQHGEEYEIEM